MVIDLRKNADALPGSGKIQAYHAHLHPLTGKFVQYLVRNNQFFVKRIPTEKGKINWTVEGQHNWDVYDFGQSTNIPTTGNVSAYVIHPIVSSGADGSRTVTFYEYLTKNNQSFVNKKLSDTFVQGKLTAQSDGGYEFLVSQNIEIQGQADYVDYTGTVLRQNWIQGNIAYMRDVPIENGTPNYSKAAATQAVADFNKNQNALSGSGDFEAYANYISCWSI